MTTAFQETAFQSTGFQTEETEETSETDINYTPQDFPSDIRDRFPEHSPIHEIGNIGSKLIDSIGRELSNIEGWIFSNSDARFLSRATGIYLDRYGILFGLPRPGGMNDDTYRAHLISLRSSDITITGVKKAIAAILDIDTDEILITNSFPNYCTVGGVVMANMVTGTTCRFSGRYNTVTKTMTIQVPSGSDVDLLESVIYNMVIPGVTVVIEEV